MYDLINYVLFWFVQIIQIGETVFLLFFFFKKKKKEEKTKEKRFKISVVEVQKLFEF